MRKDARRRKVLRFVGGFPALRGLIGPDEWGKDRAPAAEGACCDDIAGMDA